MRSVEHDCFVDFVFSLFDGFVLEGEFFLSDEDFLSFFKLS